MARKPRPKKALHPSAAAKTISFELKEFGDGRVHVLSATIDGRKYEGYGSDCIPLPFREIADIPLSRLDDRVCIETAVATGDRDWVDAPPCRLRRIAAKRAVVQFHVHAFRALGHLTDVAPDRYMEALKASVERRARMKHDVRLNMFHISGRTAFIEYEATFSGRLVGDIVKQANNLALAIEDGPNSMAKSPPQREIPPDPHIISVHRAVLEWLVSSGSAPDRRDLWDALKTRHGRDAIDTAVRELHFWGFVHAPPRSRRGVSLQAKGRDWLAHNREVGKLRPARRGGSGTTQE